MINYKKCPLCESNKIVSKFEYTSKPEFETDFGFSKKDYYREFWECKSCKHMMSIMDFDHKKFYEGEYSNSTYGKEINNIFDLNKPLVFNKIMLPSICCFYLL